MTNRAKKKAKENQERACSICGLMAPLILRTVRADNSSISVWRCENQHRFSETHTPEEE